MMTPSIKVRMACWLYEGMLLFGVVYTAGYFFSVLTQAHSGSEHRLAIQMLCFLVLGLYFVWFWRKGQTLAMKTWRIRMQSADGSLISTPTALLRYLLSWIWFAPPLVVYATGAITLPQLAWLACAWIALWALLARFAPERQFWHDVWARTRLVCVENIRK